MFGMLSHTKLGGNSERGTGTAGLDGHVAPGTGRRVGAVSPGPERSSRTALPSGGDVARSARVADLQTFLSFGVVSHIMVEEEPNAAVDVAEVERSEAGVLMTVVTEGVIGAAGGLVGTAVTVGILVVAASVGAFDLLSVRTLAVWITPFFPGRATTLGFLVFFGHGMFIWPLLLASIGRYLPGDRFALKGLPFGVVLWSGFVVVFYSGQSGLALVVYLALSLLAHLGYGFALGSVFDYFSSEERFLLGPNV